MTIRGDQRLLAEVAPWKQLHEGERETDVQSGDLQGLSWDETMGSESVAGLAAEGQAWEADAITGVAEAGEDQSREVTTRQLPEDDVPEEYRNAER